MKERACAVLAALTLAACSGTSLPANPAAARAPSDAAVRPAWATAEIAKFAALPKSIGYDASSKTMYFEAVAGRTKRIDKIVNGAVEAFASPSGLARAGIAADPTTHDVFVSTATGIDVFSASGTLKSSIAIPQMIVALAYHAGSLFGVGSGEIKKIDVAKKTVAAFAPGECTCDGVAVDSKTGELFVTDLAKHELKVFSSKGGEPIRTVTFDRFEWPSSVAVDAIGNAYVVTRGSIRQVRPDGSQAVVYGGGRQAPIPVQIASDPTVAGVTFFPAVKSESVRNQTGYVFQLSR
jgi:DNA-binding beta-propeller fold protein YncE